MIGPSGEFKRSFSCQAKKGDKKSDKEDDEKNGKRKEPKEKAALEDYPAPNWEGIERKVSTTPPLCVLDSYSQASSPIQS